VQWNALEAEDCSVARTLAIIGDRWTLLIIRECFLKVRRFDDFHQRLGIGRAILADRLHKLSATQVLAKVAYSQNPPRYEYRLTAKGLDLHPVIMAIVHWGDLHTTGDAGRPLHHRHLSCGERFDPVTICSHCREPLHARDVRVEPRAAGRRDSDGLSGAA
jgi:DNA-binding HxlR family transcriptional regulator